MAVSMGAGTGAALPRATRPRRVVTGVAVVLVALLALAGAGRVLDLLPSFGNPFATTTVDRTGPALLKALDDISEYHAATGDFQVVVDVEEDTRFVPSIIKGERAVLVATGSVDAVVDLSSLGPDAVEVSGDRAVITLPAPMLSGTRLDTEETRVVSRSRGLLDRVGSVFSDSPTSERSLYLLAEEKIRAAAGADGALVARARRNTATMLERLGRSLGVDEVVVRYAAAPQ